MPIAIGFFVGHAYAILFLWVLVEQLGIPIPSIPLLLTAGTLSATHRISFPEATLAVLVSPQPHPGTPHEHTILGFRVEDVPAAVKALRQKGVTFNIYPHFHQDELGILAVPGGAVQVAWFKDPDGNVLSVTNA